MGLGVRGMWGGVLLLGEADALRRFVTHFIRRNNVFEVSNSLKIKKILKG